MGITTHTPAYHRTMLGRLRRRHDRMVVHAELGCWVKANAEIALALDGIRKCWPQEYRAVMQRIRSITTT